MPPKVVVRVFEPLTDEFEVSVKAMSGETKMTMKVRAHHNVMAIKSEIHSKLGIPMKQQRLIFNEILLKDDTRLDSYEIREDVALTLVTVEAEEVDEP